MTDDNKLMICPRAEAEGCDGSKCRGHHIPHLKREWCDKTGYGCDCPKCVAVDAKCPICGGAGKITLWWNEQVQYKTLPCVCVSSIASAKGPKKFTWKKLHHTGKYTWVNIVEANDAVKRLEAIIAEVTHHYNVTTSNVSKLEDSIEYHKKVIETQARTNDKLRADLKTNVERIDQLERENIRLASESVQDKINLKKAKESATTCIRTACETMSENNAELRDFLIELGGLLWKVCKYHDTGDCPSRDGICYPKECTYAALHGLRPCPGKDAPNRETGLRDDRTPPDQKNGCSNCYYTRCGARCVPGGMACLSWRPMSDGEPRPPLTGFDIPGFCEKYKSLRNELFSISHTDQSVQAAKLYFNMLRNQEIEIIRLRVGLTKFCSKQCPFPSKDMSNCKRCELRYHQGDSIYDDMVADAIEKEGEEK